MKKIFNLIAVIFLILAVSFSAVYWITGIYYPITGISLILFIIATAGYCRMRKKG